MKRGVAALLFSALAACSGGSTKPFPGPALPALTTVDRNSGQSCSVSADGFIWYTLPSGVFPAIDFTLKRCPGQLLADVTPPLPRWASANGPTRAIFVATSLQEAYAPAGMQHIEALGASSRIPITWMVGNTQYLTGNAALYNQYHDANGDDVQLEQNPALARLAASAFPWFAPSVSVIGGGRYRNFPGVLALGEHAFWGITWNSYGTDQTYDRGAPWGSYCADITSYKRPDPGGNCSMVAFEWTARDLTRAVLANTDPEGYSAEAAFSTDPDDVLDRGGFSIAAGAAYERSIIDAYAAAGVSQPIVVMSQQESSGEASGVDDPILGAIYTEARRDGMQVMTLQQAATAAAQFSARPRAVAFPFIFGGMTTSYNGAPFTPATIDYHDNAIGMTFVAGHTTPMRAYEYAADSHSFYYLPLAPLLAAPALTGVAATKTGISFQFSSPWAMRYGVAIWADPTDLNLSGANVTPAGHAGFVAAFDLPAGTSTQTVTCSCGSTTFRYSI